MSESQELLAEYAKNGSEAAFRKLVSSYVDLVYSTAFRIVGRDQALAEDVTQTVFVDLARKARTLSPKVMLGGWLHRNTCFAAAKAVRGEQRRRERERQAVEMNALMNDSEENYADVAPILDEAINQMEPEDRLAVLLRFYERQDFRSIGCAVGTSEDGARMRVNRALEKLHALLRQKGVTASVAAVGSVLTVEAVTAAPAGLSSKVATAAFAGSSGALGLMSVLAKCTTLAGGVKVALVLVISTVVVTLVGSYASQRQQSRQTSANDVFSVPLSAKSDSRIADPSGLGRSIRAARPTLADLTNAKQELRALLERPQQQTQYPPQQLIAALSRFGPEWLEAIPILLERTDTPDFETRKWALYGIWEMFVNLRAVPERSPAPEIQAQALFLVRPRLSTILGSPSEPIELRRIAAQTLVPSWAVRKTITASGKEEIIVPPRPLDEATLADIIAVLQSKDRKSEGLRFELVQPLLTQQVASFPEEGRTIRNALAPLLEQGDSRQQLLAAFALAALPGERPPGLVDIFVGALDMRGKTDLSYTYRAADALGMMGAEAKEAAPALLAFAEATKSWGTADYRERALEAACRIQPELRQKYPEIDAKLKKEEAAQLQTAASPSAPLRFADLGTALADPAMGTNVLGMLVGQVKQSADPGQKRQELLAELLTLWGNAPEPQRGPIQRAMDTLQATRDQQDGKEPPALSLRALLVDGRVLLLEQKTTKEPALHELFNQWDAWYRANPTEDKVTCERFQELSQAINQVDSEFHKAWLKQVSETYPNLDRVIGGEKR
ncbi:MAG TPA: sigma-70 family RNA polymerase sigma factor [Verrucomicrobiae bacterium]